MHFLLKHLPYLKKGRFTNSAHYVVTTMKGFRYLMVGNAFFNGAGAPDYNRQDQWGGQCNNGSRQSPIDINTFCISPTTRDLTFTGFDRGVSLLVTNKGYTVQHALTGSNRPTVSGGRLPGTYILENFHFHWPSEHKICGKAFDLEGHFVFYWSKYNNSTEAQVDGNGLTVVGVFYQIKGCQGPNAIAILANATCKVSKTVKDTTTIDSLVLNELLPKDKSFYTYEGSLTTPNCSEIVIWNVFEQPVSIAKGEYEKMTTIYDSNGAVTKYNNRKLQPLNERVICYRGVPY